MHYNNAFLVKLGFFKAFVEFSAKSTQIIWKPSLTWPGSCQLSEERLGGLHGFPELHLIH